MTSHDYYELLQVSPKADLEVIKAAYKRLALKYHPDTGGKFASSDKMRLLIEAHDILTDPDKRQKYDRQRATESDILEKLRLAAQFIDRKDYFQAKSILETLNHPTAKQMLNQLNILLSQKAKTSVPKQGTSSTPESLDTKIEKEVHRIHQKAKAEEDNLKRQKIQWNKLIEQKIEQEKILIGVYQKLGHQAFEWKGFVDKRSYIGVRKLVAWESIQSERYEEAYYNISYLIEFNHADKDVKEWEILIRHIMGNEIFLEKLKRLGGGGVIDYPVELPGCTSSCGGCLLTLITTVLFIIGSSNLKDSGIFFLVLAGLLFWLGSEFKPNWRNFKSRQS